MRKLLEAEYANQQLERARQRLQSQKVGQGEATRANQAELQQKKKEEADVLREQSRRISAYVAMQQDAHLERAKRINHMIKEHSQGVQQDKMRARMEHEETLQAEMEERMLLEERRRNAADRLIADMEEAEEVAIERLRRTQEEQKNAYEELERARTSVARMEQQLAEGNAAAAKEMEEAAALSKWVENVPMMTIEGQPLSENVKKRRDACIKQAMDYCRATGRKFTDTSFPRADGRAEGELQPSVYTKGRPTAGMPRVTQWLRPEEFVNHYDPRYPQQGGAPRQPLLWKSLYEVEGIIQGASMDNRWFISALNIVAGNRGQLDRIFFGEVDPTWVTYGFFVCKFYQDDPMSDDDWQVILVDDRIPCDSNGHPVFCRHPDQRTYWGMIIEKAYAKFAGCYEAMQGGTVTQGLEDFTGGVGYKFDLAKREKEWIPPKGETPERLWDEVRR